jgi:hypothetical protein
MSVEKIPDAELWKTGASRYAEYHRDIRQLLSAEFSSNVRWLTASLFALNAGGLASLATRNPPASMQQCAGTVFWLGIAFAFVLVGYSQQRTNKFLGIIQKIENYWINVSVTGCPNDDEIAALESKKNRVSTNLAPIFAVSSFLMFSIALVLTSKT